MKEEREKKTRNARTNAQRSAALEASGSGDGRVRASGL